MNSLVFGIYIPKKTKISMNSLVFGVALVCGSKDQCCCARLHRSLPPLCIPFGLAVFCQCIAWLWWVSAGHLSELLRPPRRAQRPPCGADRRPLPNARVSRDVRRMYTWQVLSLGHSNYNRSPASQRHARLSARRGLSGGARYLKGLNRGEGIGIVFESVGVVVSPALLLTTYVKLVTARV